MIAPTLRNWQVKFWFPVSSFITSLRTTSNIQSGLDVSSGKKEFILIAERVEVLRQVHVLRTV